MSGVASPAPGAQAAKGVGRERPRRLCDVVMKGGITSGVVYPNALLEIAATYRLKNVGGTSAGAIAAAIGSAAEYGRAQGGYERLAELPGWLGEDGNLAGLFQAQAGTRRIHALLLAAIEHPGIAAVPHVLLAALKGFPFSALLGAAPGLALLALALLGGSGALQIAAAFAGVLLVIVLTALALAIRVARAVLKAIPANMFGICSGMAGHESTRDALTPWLTQRIDDAADHPSDSGPLTFGHLWAGPGAPAATAMPKDPFLRLEMVTTNVTNHRAERLPTASREFYFDPGELRDLFGEPVVLWMIDHPPALSEQPAAQRDELLRRAQLLPLHPLPAAAELPVVVAARMSLSFPVLLSAVPLWRIDFTREHNQRARRAGRAWLQAHPGEDWEQLLEDPQQWSAASTPPLDPERCWFSDGGISSNFPVHFFDAPLPRHPTFAINLRPFHPDRAPPPGADPPPPQSDHVWMPEHHPDGNLDWWYRFEGKLDGFLGNIVQTMQNRVDDAQMRVPGYRDRIVHVSLADHEGGLNLNMKAGVITALTERGRWAGRRLVERFAQPPAEPDDLSWEDHRWVRLRTSFAATAEMLRELMHGWKDPTLPGERSYEQLLEREPGTHPTSYPMTAGQRAIAAELADRVEQVVARLDAAGQSLATDAPSPAPAMRMVARDQPLLPPDGGDG